MFEKSLDQSTSIMILQEVIDNILDAGNGDFYELGGTSMDAIMIESALLERGYALSAADILQNPEIRDMATLMIPAQDIDWEAD